MGLSGTDTHGRLDTGRCLNSNHTDARSNRRPQQKLYKERLCAKIFEKRVMVLCIPDFTGEMVNGLQMKEVGRHEIRFYDDYGPQRKRCNGG